jgi:hypothetical protein
MCIELPGSFSIGEKGRVHAVAQRGLAHGALEQEDLVGARHRIGVLEVHFELRRAGFVDQRIDVEFHRLGVVVHQVEDRVELVDRVDGIALARRLRPARAARGRLQREVRIGVLLHQEEFELGRHHRREAQFLVERQHAAQHVARRQFVRAAVAGVVGSEAQGTMRTVAGSGRRNMSESEGDTNS